MFLPTTYQEMRERGWDRLDIILVTGDAYIDSPHIGIALIGKVLAAAGYRVGIIGQPWLLNDQDITRLGEPRLFWGVTAGCVDSMVANRTPTGRPRRKDDFTPGGMNDRRPDRALIAYTNLIKRYARGGKPIVLGGIEASLRRIAHYDYWSDSIRRSILFDAKADYLLYGMAENSVLALAHRLAAGSSPLDIAGLCHISKAPPDDLTALPSFEEVADSPESFMEMFRLFYANTHPPLAKGLYQRHGDRFLVHNPPPSPLTQQELDRVYDLPFAREAHPCHQREGHVRALDTIRFSIATHRGCYGECHFCAIAVHQGRTVQWRSMDSIVREARVLAGHPSFRGTISDLGGPTANMYGFECAKKLKQGPCADKRCLFPRVCPKLGVNHAPQIHLLREVRRLGGITRVSIGSGVRHDLVMADDRNGGEYLREIAAHHVSGQLKIAPEHCEDHVLRLMGKPGIADLASFQTLFQEQTRRAGKKQFLTYYLMAAHPGCTEEDMARLRDFCSRELFLTPEQVQIFTPTPSTYSTLMYATGVDPFSRKRIFVEKRLKGKEKQKEIVTGKKKKSKTMMANPPGNITNAKRHHRF